jgi:hypothetical protein
MGKRNATLDDPAARQTVIDVVHAGGTLDDAAAKLGISRRAIGKYRDKDADFDDRVQAALGRREAVRERLPTLAPRKRYVPSAAGQLNAALRMGVGDDLVRDADSFGGMTADELLDLCEQIAMDPDHRANGQALRILAEIKLGPMMRATLRREQMEQRELERAEQADGAGDVLVVELPDNGTHAPRGPQGQAIDVEVLDG